MQWHYLWRPTLPSHHEQWCHHAPLPQHHWQNCLCDIMCSDLWTLKKHDAGCTVNVASFPGPTQLFVAFRAWESLGTRLLHANADQKLWPLSLWLVLYVVLSWNFWYLFIYCLFFTCRQHQIGIQFWIGIHIIPTSSLGLGFQVMCDQYASLS